VEQRRMSVFTARTASTATDLLPSCSGVIAKLFSTNSEKSTPERYSKSTAGSGVGCRALGEVAQQSQRGDIRPMQGYVLGRSQIHAAAQETAGQDTGEPVGECAQRGAVSGTACF
jgi:hypothetical protein